LIDLRRVEDKLFSELVISIEVIRFYMEERIKILKIVDSLRKQGYSLDEACKLLGITEEQYYNWKRDVRYIELEDERDYLKDYGYFL